jgi:hypothetical protein
MIRDVSIEAREIAARLDDPGADDLVEALVDRLLELRSAADAGPREVRGMRRCALAQALGRAALRGSARAVAALQADLADDDGFGGQPGEDGGEPWWVGVRDVAAEALAALSPRTRRP